MKLLKQLFAIHSPSGNEKKMRRFIIWWIKSNVPGATIVTDQIGNIYVKKGNAETYPCIASHIDQVQKTHSKDFQAMETDDIIFGFSLSHRQQEGVGADDKCGIWIALKCLKKFDTLKAVFFVQEEIGCRGSAKADMQFFDDCRYVIQCDRRNGTDLITNIGGWTELCSEDFVNALGADKFGYKQAKGMITDVGQLKENGLAISAINLSCGYYEPHTDHEFVMKAEVLNCLAFVENIITNLTQVYPHEANDGCGFYAYGEDPDDMWNEEYDMAYDELEYIILNQPDVDENQLVGWYKELYRLSEEELRSIIHDIKRINLMD